MAIGAAGVAAINAGAAILSTGANAYSQGKMNRSSREFAKEQMWRQNEINIENWKMQNQYNEEMWGKQNEYDRLMRDDQRAHELSTWMRENEYNSPREQMQRFQEAGLNPHMIAGSSNAMGGSISTSNMDTKGMNSADVPPASKAEWNPKAPQIDPHLLSGAIMEFVNIDTKKAQQDLLSQQAALARKEQDLVAAKAITELSEGKIKGLNYEMESALKETSMDAKREMLRKLKADTDYTLNQDKRADKSLEMSVKEGLARIDLLKQQTTSEKQKQAIQDVELIIKKLEATWGSGFFGIPGIIGRLYNGLKQQIQGNNKEGYYFKLQ